MTNKEIAAQFKLLAELLELHGENDFKTKSYYYAAQTLKNLDTPVLDLNINELAQLKGIGKAIAQKLYQLIHEGKIDLLEQYLQLTPTGVVELLAIKGIGPKKVKLLWQEHQIQSIGELYYACTENRLIALKGFGAKTQEAIKQDIEFKQKNANQFLWAQLEPIANDILTELQLKYPTNLIDEVGAFKTKELVLEHIDILIAIEDEIAQQQIIETYQHYPVQFHFCSTKDFHLFTIKLTSSTALFSLINSFNINKYHTNENDYFNEAQLPYIPAECRLIENIEKSYPAQLIQLSDIKGIVHTHTIYSDGSNTIQQMADVCRQQQYNYLVISDHSKSAFYANGLTEERIIQQHQEIDTLNKTYSDFKILKSIECDILNNGSLDYNNDILQTFDIVICSIHSQLNMNEEKAMNRLIKAIEHPFCHILGHLTGRLLLARKAYPINHKKIIDACAANSVAIELNANPYRLDIDYSFINYCQEKGVKISINPDAHHIGGIQDIRYGVIAARKGLLLKENCINTYSVNDFTQVAIKK